MSQHDLDIANQGFAAFRADLNNALQALGSLSSGDTAPATPYSNQLWYETDANTLHIRNEANSAWLDLMVIDQSTGSPSFTGQTMFADGSASSPSISNIGDTNAGIFFPAADTVAVSTNGTERVRIHASGGVSIGNTTDPGAGSLTVNGSLVYTRGNIVGTVSQSSGAPTGAIIEKGSNANGNYVRYADGTQICYRDDFEITPSAANTPTSATWTFPAAFGSTTNLIVLATANSSVVGTIVTGVATSGTTSTTTLVWVTRINTTATFIQMTAIGRWY